MKPVFDSKGLMGTFGFGVRGGGWTGSGMIVRPEGKMLCKRQRCYVNPEKT